MAGGGMNTSHTQASGRWTIGKKKEAGVFNSSSQEPECEIGSDSQQIQDNKTYSLLFSQQFQHS